MKIVRQIILILSLSISKSILANNEIINPKPRINPLSREYMKSTFNFRFYQGFGFRNVCWDLDFNFRYRQYFSIGIGNGFHRNKYPIFSSSDKHVLNMWSYPLYLTGNVYLFANSDRAWYLYGKYGRSFGLRTKGVNPTDDFKSLIAEGGIGYEYLNGPRSVYLELGQYYTSANGVFNSTYNSTILYDLQIYTIVCRFGVKINF